jgi:hypothetical protein
MSRGVPCLLMRGGCAWRVGARLQPRSRSGCHPNAVRFWMDFSAAALRAALKAVIASVSCRPLVCSTRGARHTPLRTDIKSSIRIIEVHLVHWIPMIRFEQSASKEAEGMRPHRPPTLALARSKLAVGLTVGAPTVKVGSGAYSGGSHCESWQWGWQWEPPL